MKKFFYQRMATQGSCTPFRFTLYFKKYPNNSGPVVTYLVLTQSFQSAARTGESTPALIVYPNSRML